MSQAKKSDTPNEETLTFRIQIQRDSKKKQEKKMLQRKITIEEEGKKKSVILAIKRHLIEKRKSRTTDINNQEGNNSETRQQSIDEPPLDVAIVNRKQPIISIMEGKLKQSKPGSSSSTRFRASFAYKEDRKKYYPSLSGSGSNKITISKSPRLSKTIDTKTLIFEEEEKLETKKKYSDDRSIETMTTRPEIPSSVSIFSYEIKQQEKQRFLRSDALRKDLYKQQRRDIVDFIGKEKKRKEDRKALINTMRKNLPNYDLTEIREMRLPFHEAVFINMADNFYKRSVALGKEILQFQDNLRKNALPGAIVLIKPLLKFNKEEFTLLMQSLKTAEDYYRENKLNEECEELLKLSIAFAFQDIDDWWWVGEQLLVRLIKLSSSYAPQIGHKFEALSRYTYGRYLLDKCKEFKNASAQLKISRLLAQGKGWSCKSYFPEARGTLFTQCNHGIYNCLIKEVKFYISNQDYDKAIVLADQARKRAAEACYRNGETQALVLRGICEMETDHLKASISSLLRAYSIQERFGNIEGLCKIRIHLAKAYLMDKCANSSLKILLELKRDAEHHNLPYYMGLAYKNLGQYYLLIGENSKAAPLLQQSLKIFNKCELSMAAYKELQSAKTLKEISGGLQLFPKYVDLLLDVVRPGLKGQESLKALLLWKEDRTEFWNDYDNLICYNSCEDILSESVKRVARSSPDFLNKKLKEVTGQ